LLFQFDKLLINTLPMKLLNANAYLKLVSVALKNVKLNSLNAII